MAHFFCSFCSSCMRKWDKTLLALSWVLGLGCGGLLFRYSGSNLVSQMPSAVISRPSIFGLLVSSFLPLLFSAFAVYICVPYFLYGICFIKACSFAYVSCAVFAVYHNAAWLIRGLLLFTDLIGSAALYHYCHRHISGFRKYSAKSLISYAALSCFITLVDYRYISPFLRNVVS